MKYIAVLSLLLFVCILGYFFITQSNKPSPQSDRLAVSVSFYPLAYFAKRIGGDKTDIYTITPSGVEPHDYEPTVQDMVHITKSRLLILNGKGLESWGDKVRETIVGSSTKIIVAGSSIPTQSLNDNGISKQDPHVWLSPPIAIREIGEIEKGLSDVDPENMQYYQEHKEQLVTDIETLDAAYRTGLRQCARRDFITSHAAFGYMAAAYGLHQVSIAGLSPDEEPSAKQLITIATFAKTNNIRFIFFEALVSPKLSETIAHEVGAQTMVLDPIEGISPDNVRAGKNYISIMQDNLHNLRIALGCQ